MEEQFIPYNLALKLKELGFNEPCFKSSPRLKYPLWQQAFDWFRVKYNLYAYPIPYINNWWVYNIRDLTTSREKFYTEHPSFEESRLACLEKLIEICQEQKEELEQKK